MNKFDVKRGAYSGEITEVFETVRWIAGSTFRCPISSGKYLTSSKNGILSELYFKRGCDCDPFIADLFRGQVEHGDFLDGIYFEDDTYRKNNLIDDLETLSGYFMHRWIWYGVEDETVYDEFVDHEYTCCTIVLLRPGKRPDYWLENGLQGPANLYAAKPGSVPKAPTYSEKESQNESTGYSWWQWGSVGYTRRVEAYVKDLILHPVDPDEMFRMIAEFEVQHRYDGFVSLKSIFRSLCPEACACSPYPIELYGFRAPVKEWLNVHFEHGKAHAMLDLKKLIFKLDRSEGVTL